MPCRTLCLRVDEHKNIGLYVPRCEDKDIMEIINIFLDDPDNESRHLLITGQRGVGKSFAMHAALHNLKGKRSDFIPIIVYCEQYYNIKELLEKIGESFSRKINSIFKDDFDLIKTANYVNELLKCDELISTELYSRTNELKKSLTIDYNIFTIVKLTFGISEADSEENSASFTSNIKINNSHRLQLIDELFSEVFKATRKKPVLFIDNLDQIMDKNISTILMKYIIRFKKAPVIITIRNEFLSRNIHRELDYTYHMEGLKQHALISILENRLAKSPDGEKLQEKGILHIAKELSKITNNPRAFLVWLNWLCWYSDLELATYKRTLIKGFVVAYFGLLHPQVRRVAMWFSEQDFQFFSVGALKEQLGLDDAEIYLLADQNVLIPYDINREYSLQEYSIEPILHFFKLCER